MAETQVTTSEAQIHTPATEYSDLDYFTYPAIFSAMADSVKKHDPELFKSCADSIDMGHVSTLRGLSYLGQLLAGDKEASDMQRMIAAGTIAEMTAFVATLIEMKNEANILKLFPNSR